MSEENEFHFELPNKSPVEPIRLELEDQLKFQRREILEYRRQAEIAEHRENRKKRARPRSNAARTPSRCTI